MNNNQENYTQHYMIEFKEAIKLIEEHSTELGSESVAWQDSLNRVLAKPIVAPISIPNFDNTAMDGYAVNSIDLKSATPSNPITLNIAGLTAAGDPANLKEESNSMTAWKIMTGAPVPLGYDSIIPVENTHLSENNTKVDCLSSPLPGAHIRKAGEDFVSGETVMGKSQLIGANQMMAIAALGITNCELKKKPKIAVFSTGKELVEDPNIELQPGQIRNSNMPYILSYLSALPVDAFNAGTNYDDVDEYEKALKKQLDSNTDIIISTGAVSMGDFDFIPQTIRKLGGTIIFHKCKIKPGKPILFAKFDNGSFYFGLPGNPISATIGLRFFVVSLLERLLGYHSNQPLRAQLDGHLSTKAGFRNILKANACLDSHGRMIVTPLHGQESFRINPMISANGWIVVNELDTKLDDKTLVEFYPNDVFNN